MTTPGNGDNEITFVTRVVSGGDEARVARQVGEEAQRAYRQGVESGGAARLPALDPSGMYQAIDSALEQMETRVHQAARNMGMSLRESMGGQMRLAGHELTAEWDRFSRDMENLGARWRGSIQDAVRNDLRIMERGHDYASTTNRQGRPLNWAFNEEGRQALSMRGERYDPGRGTESYYQGGNYPVPPRGGTHGAPFEAGDIDRLRERAFQAISRVVLDDATYAFENGEFFRTNARGQVMRSRGSIDNPELLGRLQQATFDQMQQVQDQLVRESLAEVTSRDSRFSRLAIDPQREYPYGRADEGKVAAAQAEVTRLQARIREIEEGVARAAQRGGREGLVYGGVRAGYLSGRDIDARMMEQVQSERVHTGLQAGTRLYSPDRTSQDAQTILTGLRATMDRLNGELAAARSGVASASRLDTLPGHDIADWLNTSLTQLPGRAGLEEALDVLRHIGIQAPETVDALQRELYELVRAEEAAARATQQAALAARAKAEAEAAYSARHSQLQAAFGNEDSWREYTGMAANDRAAMHLMRQAQDRAYATYEPNLQAGGAGGRGSGGGPPAPPIGSPDEFNDREDENFYIRALRYRREMAEAAREEAYAQRLIQQAQERAYASYAQNIAATSYRGNIAATQARESEQERQRRVLESPIGRLGARESAYEQAQAVRRALGEQTEGLRTFTITAADLPQRAQRLGEAMSEAARALQTVQARLNALEHVQHRVGDTLSVAEQDRLGRTSLLGGTTTVRVGAGDQYATVAANGRLQALDGAEALARAQREVSTATEGAAAAARVETRALHDMTDAQLQAVIAQQRLNRAMAEGDAAQQAQALLQSRRAVQALRNEEQQSRGGLGGFFSSAWTGFTMARGSGEQGDNNAFLRLRAENGEFLGAIARYQAAYAVIFGLSQGFAAMARAEVDAQDQMVEFSHATHTAGEEATRLANAMGIIGGQAGFSVAQSMAAATRGIFAFQSQMREGVEASDIAAESVRQAAAIRLIAPTMDPNNAQTQLIASTNGFQLGFEGQSRVLDAAYNAMQNYGGAVEETIAALPTLSQVAEQAGLSVEEMANMVSLAVSRTAMNGTGVASLINRTFGNLNAKPEVRTMMEQAGIDASGSAGQTIYNLAGAWDTLSKAQQNQIMSALGGHEVARALLPILNEGTGLLDANARSYENVGSAAELVNEKQANLAGVLRDIQGQLQNFGRALVDTGAFDLIGAALTLISPMVEGVNSILRLMTLLPGESERWVIMLAEALAILTLIGRAQAANLAAQQAQTAAAAGTAAATTTQGLLGFADEGLDLVDGDGDGRRRRGFRGRARGIGAGALGGLSALMTGASGAAIGLIALSVAIGGTVQAVRAHREAEEEATSAREDFTAARSVDELRASASRLGNAATNQAEANSGFFGGLTASPEDRMRADLLLQQSQWASGMATSIEQDIRNRSADPFGAYFNNSGDLARDLASGLSAMTQAGLAAEDMLSHMTLALQAAADTKIEGGVFNTRQTVSDLAQAAAGVVQGFGVDHDDVVPTFSYINNYPQMAGAGAMPDVGGMRERLKGFNPEVVQQAIDEALRAADVAPGEAMDDATQAALIEAVLANLGVDDLLTPEARERLHAGIRDAVQAQLTEQAQSPVAQLFTEADFNKFVIGEGETPGQLLPLLQSRAGVDPRRLNANEAVQQRQVTLLRTLRDQGRRRGFTGAGMRVVEDQLAAAEHDLVQSQIARMERLREAALVGVMDPAQIDAINTASTIEQAQAAVNAGDETALLDVMNRSTNAALDAVRALLQKAYEVALAAQEEAARLVVPPGTDPSDVKFYNMARNIRGREAQAAVDAAKGNLDAFDSTRKQRVPTGTRAQADEVDPAALEQARIMSRAVAGDPVSQAAAARDAARAQVRNAQNETERLQAQRALNDANRQYTEAVSQVTQASIMASVDPRDTIGQASARVRAAREALRTAVRGTAEWHNARQQLAEAQVAYADAQNAVANARDAALNARPGNNLAQAAQGVRAAERELAQAYQGSVEWWNAYAALQQAQYDYSQAVMEAHHQSRLRGVDLTDPVAMARAELEAANERVAYVRQTGNGNLDEEINNQRRAQANAESAAFEQRFSDVQHAHDMGRMSHQAYMAYLESERARLMAIGNKTRQQTEQLQQIDSAIKAAADALDGQWNIGDIRIPTPYEARRYIDRATRGLQYQQGAAITNTQTNHISFTGLTRQEVEQVLRDVLGASTTQRTATTARKV